MFALEQGGVHRAGRTVLHPATVPLPEGGTVGIVGMNGAGKSTLFHALAGLLPSGSGGAVVRGSGGAIGYAPQQPAFPEWLMVEEVARLYRQESSALAARYPELLLGEIAGRSAGALSVGQRQVLAVALALALDTRLTLLDEPFAPLDFRRRIGLVRTLQPRRRGPGITLISSQAAVDLLDTCDWLLVLRDGRYLYSGPVTDLSGDGAGEATRRQFEESIMTMLLESRATAAADAPQREA